MIFLFSGQNHFMTLQIEKTKEVVIIKVETKNRKVYKKLNKLSFAIINKRSQISLTIFNILCASFI